MASKDTLLNNQFLVQDQYANIIGFFDHFMAGFGSNRTKLSPIRVNIQPTFAVFT